MRVAARLLVATLCASSPLLPAQQDAKTVRVFVFAGQSNMVGSDSHVADVADFPPFAHAAEPQPAVRFWYVIGREDKLRSDGWVPLQPVDGVVGPELTFAREVTARTDAPLAIVKIAAGGTTLGRDWNPDEPGGFELYPLALTTVRAALADLDRRRVKWQLEGFVWHQGENDMFDEAFRPRYGDNLANFIACWRRDLGVPGAAVLRRRAVHQDDLGHGPARADARDRGRPAAGHRRRSAGGVRPDVARRRGDRRGGGLHYHYGTLGQLEHGVDYADAYLRTIGKGAGWPALAPGRMPRAAPIDLYVLAGHRNMEGERAFVQELADVKGGRALRRDRQDIAFRYVTGGGVHRSDGWEPLGPAGLYDTFGPELSFGRALARQRGAHVAIAKFTHSGSQIVDWTPAGSAADTRNLYGAFVAFVQESIADLERRGHPVRLAGIVYHLGENDMSWGPHRRQAAKWLGELVAASRKDLALPELRWFVSQQPPTAHADVDSIDVVADLRALAAADPHLFHVEVFDPPPQRRALVLDTAGIVWLGDRLATAVLR
ncbi:MAG: hypothetical protein IPM29_00010 [Planctomycetes bacterium]|nr:hypothetical protein [Planctomycetota bacterium]